MKTRLLQFASLSILCLFNLARAQTPTVTNPEVEAIRKEMQLMRADYEQRIHALEERLQKVETATVRTDVVTNPVTVISTNVEPTMAERGMAFANLQFAGDTETRDRALAQPDQPIKDRVQKILNDFIDFNGYFRSGYGRDDQGGPQPAFQAPGAFAKYRLGNEAETYGELIFGKNWYVPDLFSPDAPPCESGACWPSAFFPLFSDATTSPNSPLPHGISTS